jgi:hypothetical protein
VRVHQPCCLLGQQLGVIGAIQAVGSRPYIVSGAFTCWTGFAVGTARGSGHPRGMPLVRRMQEIQASKRWNQWHPRVQDSVEKRAPYCWINLWGCSRCPSVLRHNLQCQPVRKWTLERNDIGRTHARASSGAGVGSNSRGSCKILFKTEHRTYPVREQFGLGLPGEAWYQ